MDMEFYFIYLPPSGPFSFFWYSGLLPFFVDMFLLSLRSLVWGVYLLLSCAGVVGPI